MGGWVGGWVGDSYLGVLGEGGDALAHLHVPKLHGVVKGGAVGWEWVGGWVYKAIPGNTSYSFLLYIGGWVGKDGPGEELFLPWVVAARASGCPPDGIDLFPVLAEVLDAGRGVGLPDLGGGRGWVGGWVGGWRRRWLE